MTEGMRVLKAVEEEFDCATMCETSRYFTFSDVAEGIPPKNCTQAVYDFMDKRFPAIAGVMFAFAVVILLGLISTFIICCAKDQKGWL